MKKNIQKILNTLTKNLGLTIVLLASIVLFVIFSKGLVSGIIAALSAIVAYACATLLYKEYKKPAISNSKPKMKKSAKRTLKSK